MHVRDPRHLVPIPLTGMVHHLLDCLSTVADQWHEHRERERIGSVWDRL